MDLTKIHLSEEEFVLVQNAEVLLTKQRIIGKVYQLFGECAERWKLYFPPQTNLPIEISSNHPKISKGEQYHQLPYVMLDYPRYFRKEEVCAIRTFFWWGHFFSVTLHLKGRWKENFLSAILRDLPELSAAGFAISSHDDEWNHTLEDQHYTLLKNVSREEIKNVISRQSFCKIASIVPLAEWKDSYAKLNRLYEVLVNVITR
ncbi:MAG TPA: hypothetical protein VM012_00355 [Flavitalea sp.]|nr:hypothetical protein [Flavitalea sp.]